MWLNTFYLILLVLCEYVPKIEVLGMCPTNTFFIYKCKKNWWGFTYNRTTNYEPLFAKSAGLTLELNE